MKCESVRPLLYRLIEDRLLASDESSVRAHLDACSDCMIRLRRIAELDESVMNADSEHPSDSLRPKLLTAYRRAMANQRTKSSAWGRRTAVMRRAAVIALVAFGSGTLTWLGVRQHELRSLSPIAGTEAPIALDHVFPLRFTVPYTVMHVDGTTERGVRIQFVQ